MAPHPKTPSPRPLPVEHSLPVPLEEHHTHVLRLALIAMACVLCVLTFLCTLSIILKRFYHSRRYNRYNNNQNRTESPILFDFNEGSPVSDDEREPDIVHPIWFIRTVGLQQSFIDSITVFQYRKDEGLIDGTECSVCLGEFEENESLRLLPKCSHAFHIPCIDTWLRSHKNCPLCRAPVFHDTQVLGTDQNSNLSDHVQSQSQEAQTENSDGGVGLESNQVAENVTFEGDYDGSVVCASSVEEEIQPLRRSVSMDSSSALVMLRDLNSEKGSSESEARLGEKVNSSSKDLMAIVAKHGIGSSGSSSTTHKLASIGGVLQKRPGSMRRSFSHNRKFLFSKHCRSQSSTLPL
ncbi:hypothetical protein RJT34_03358 [Clitoria ternatea]|uniref:RING-type E3 ubiquitin transferase n=1 Tax=Clitoria ternatea TaxID=43366 RepID=A0AAN9KLZ5_CLITE